MLNRAGWSVVGILIATAAYELALALGAASIGSEPGEDVAGSGVVRAVAALAMLLAVALGFYYRRNGRPWPAALLPPAAAAYLVAFYFTFDPYFAPYLRRYSEGNVAGHWIAIVAVAALAVGVLTWLLPRVGTFLTGPMVIVVLFTTFLAGIGH
jgi:hypothetical protein